MKHRIKGWLREAWARALYHLGLWRLVNRMTPRRMMILAGHCVGEEAVNGGLPADMKISADRLERILRVLGAHFELVTVGEGLASLRAGGRGRSMVALSMDDGYADNLSALLPLLERVDGKATVFLESRVLDERRVNWSHKWFWLLEELGPELTTRQFLDQSQHAATLERLRRLLESDPADLAYQAKRVLKYEADPEDRDRALDLVFVARGGDEAALVERIYLDWEGVEALQASGRVELGGHTVNHPVLATLSAEEQAREVSEGRASLVSRLGEQAGVCFAYPFGRRWDFDADSRAAVAAAGYAAAVTTHSAANRADTDPMVLGRWMIDEHTPLHLLVAEVCGGFELLRRLGLDLVE
jgi:peptidoglycan/xylan/chitin deacetylase (PgdA/CDA1 family)